MPIAFHNKFGRHLADNITLICPEEHIWLVEYDKENRKLIGMEEFLRQHKVKIWSLLIFDYLGESTFCVTLFKSCGLEIEHGSETKCLVKDDSFKKSEYIVGLDEVESEKAQALCFFNGLQNGSVYYETVMTYEAGIRLLVQESRVGFGDSPGFAMWRILEFWERGAGRALTVIFGQTFKSSVSSSPIAATSSIAVYLRRLHLL